MCRVRRVDAEDLEDEDVVIFTAGDGEAALEIVQRERHPCAVPHREGTGVRPRATEAARANGYMIKPFDPDELLAVVRGALGLDGLPSA